MYTAKIENRNGDLMVLTGDEPVYQIIGIQGLNPPVAKINTTTIVGLDGARFNSARLETRNLVLTVKINGDVERNRLQLYRYFRTKEFCTFYYANGSLDVSIEGYVESVECDLFSNAEMAQISILCPFPYFRSLSEIVADSSTVFSTFVFPFSINIGEPVVISTIEEDSEGSIDVYNGSESETGVILEIEFEDDASSIEIKNTSTGDDLKLAYEFQTGDKVIVNTNKGAKSITLIRGGVLSNIFSSLQQGSTFFQLMIGNNHFEYLVDGIPNADDVSIIFRYYNLYRGV